MVARRLVAALLVALLVVLLAVSPAYAEGHYCRQWYPDATSGGYWLYRDCPQDVGDEAWISWYPDLPAYEWSNPYLYIGPPV